MTKLIEDLKWRYATKKFDAGKKISDQELKNIQEVLRLAPSSYGLQPIKYLIIENQELREQLKKHSFGQDQITDASHLIVFCAYKTIGAEHIDLHIENTTNSRAKENLNLKPYGDFLKRILNDLSSEEQENWNAKQAYIALGYLLHACAQMRIDSIPMEGFDPDGYEEVLKLEGRNLKPILLCPIGYRSSDDPYQNYPKVRKSNDELFEIIY